MKYKGQALEPSYGSHSGQYSATKTAGACLDPRSGKSNIGPGPVIPAGAGKPSSKGSITPPKQVGG